MDMTRSLPEHMGMMLKLEDMRLFVEVVDARSFSEAARRIGIPRPSASRRLAALEREVGVRLLWRTTRRMRPTDVGLQFYERCQHVLASLADAQRVITRSTAAPTGHLRIAAPPVMGALVLGDTIERYMAAHPEVTTELRVLDRRVDLRAEGYDLAVNFGPVADDSLVARPVTALEHCLCATPAYLGAAGEPRTPQALAEHRLLMFTAGDAPEPLTLTRGRKTVTVRARPTMLANLHTVLRDAARADQGIAVVPAPMCEDGLADGSLVRVLPQWRLPSVDVTLVYAGGPLVPPKLSAFLELLGAHLARTTLPCEAPPVRPVRTTRRAARRR